MAWAVYARQSVEKKNSISIESQIEFCKQAAGQELSVYVDRGYSGKNTHRPSFQKLLNDIQSGKIEKLYVYRLDRFSRSVADFGKLWEILSAHHVEFTSINENFDTTTPMGRAMLHIIMVFAQLERETTAERVKDNYYRRASLGAWPGGPAPFGFTIGRCTDSQGHAVPTLLVEPEKSEIVRRIFESYAEDGATLGSIAKALNQEGVPGPKRSTWDNVSLSRLLHTPCYVQADEQVRLHYQALGANICSEPEDFDGVHGVLLVGKRERSAKKYTDVKDHNVSVLNSVGFIPAQLWLRCQDKLIRNTQIGNNGKGKHTWLSGLLKCASCGYALKIAYKESGQRYLQCSGRYNVSRCNAVIRADLTALETEIAIQIQKMLDDVPEETVEEKRVDTYASQLDEIDRRADRLIDAFSESPNMSPTYLQRALARLDKERQQLLEARKRDSRRPILPQKLVFDHLSFDEKKLVAAQFIRRIEVGDDTAEVVWNV